MTEEKEAYSFINEYEIASLVNSSHAIQLIEGMIDVRKVAVHRDIKLNNLFISGG